MVRCLFNQALHVTAGHELGHDVELALVLSEVEDGGDMGVGAETTHSLGFAGDAAPGGIIECLGLDQSKGHVAVEEGVVGEVDLLLASLAQEALDLVATIGKGGGLR